MIVAVLFFSVLAFAGLQTASPRAQQVCTKAEAASLEQTIAKTVAISLPAQVRTEVPNQKLIAALIEKESGGDDMAIGDRYYKDRRGRLREYPKSHWAYGPLQIRKICVADVNRHFGTKYKASDCLGNRRLSVWICQKYLEIYATRDNVGRNPTDEDKARIWNGGPDGWDESSTIGYWAKVRRFL